MSLAEIDTIKRRLRDGANYSPVFDVETARRTWYAYTDGFQIPADLTRREDRAAGRDLEWIGRPGVGDNVLIYLHGGGYVCGGVSTHRPIVCELAKTLHGAVASLDYRLAPEHPFPAAVEDAVATYRDLLGRGHRPDRIAMAGESAGAGLTVATALALKAAGLPMPAALMCVSPWTDLTNSGATIESKAGEDPIVFRGAIDVTRDLYLGGASHKEPLASPAHADLRGLPPLLIQVGSSEVLLDDALMLARAAACADVEVRLEVWPQMIHAWHIFSGELEEGRRASAAAAAWLNARFRGA